jgi:GxxExxY protein
LLESAYQTCLAAEFRHHGLRVQREVPVPVHYRDVHVEAAFRIDLLVERSVVVELKVADALAPVHTSQVLTYLRLSGHQVGLLFNFAVEALAAGGIRRVVRGAGILKPSEPSAPPSSPR